MASDNPPNMNPQPSQHGISAAANEWLQQFVKHFELQFVATGKNPPQEANYSQLRLTTARAIVATFIDTGLEFESVMELFGEGNRMRPRASDLTSIFKN